MKGGYLIGLVATAIGAGVAGWFASKVYYDKKAQVVIETGRDPIDKKEDKKEPDIPKFKSPEEKLADYNSMKSIYTQALAKYNYTIPEEEEDEKSDEAPEEKPDGPYLVTHMQWGEANGYDKIDLVWYEGDRILADYDNNIYDMNEVGDDFMDSFDDNDCAHVRNDSYSRDYEIVSDPRTYREVATGE